MSGFRLSIYSYRERRTYRFNSLREALEAAMRLPRDSKYRVYMCGPKGKVIHYNAGGERLVEVIGFEAIEVGLVEPVMISGITIGNM